MGCGPGEMSEAARTVTARSTQFNKPEEPEWEIRNKNRNTERSERLNG